jgi:very-short-patch-repair endonuclease
VRGWAHEEEVPLAGGWLVVDMADSRSRVALEFDGPSHFLTDLDLGSLSVDGPTGWKSAALRELGWRVVRVRFDEWARAQATEGVREAYLGGLLAALTARDTD